jgi:hypothetical protein
MNLPEIGNIGTLLTPTATSALTRSWSVGQILQASVIEREADGALKLRVGSDVIQARSTLPLATGQSLTVQVTYSGEQTILRVVQDTTSQAALVQGWRQALPRQSELQPLLDDILRAARTPLQPEQVAQPARFSGPLSALLRAFVDALPLLRTLTRPDGLRQAVQDSGLFLEAKLADTAQTGNPPRLDSDFKVGLLRLQQQIQSDIAARSNTPAGAARPDVAVIQDDNGVDPLPRLLLPVESALARTQANQLSSLPPEPGSPSVWLVEIPVRHDAGTDTLKLQIESEATAGPEGSAGSWTVWLTLDLGERGALRARVGVVDDQVNVHFWADDPSTADLFTQNLDMLERNLQEDGLKPVVLACQTGPAPQPETPGAPPRLLDERA